ncbi:MAG: peptidoglycan-binding protein [Candidatus Taylorbacteria bacterium]
MKKYTIPTFLFACLVSVFFYSPGDARAEFSSTPDSNIPIINGVVNAVVANSSGTYIGGGFTHVGGTFVGNGVPIVTSTGLPVSTFPKANNSISAVISDRNGGWYIGGNFTQVGTETRNRLAHILSDGTVDPNFNPNMSSIVYSLALSPDGTKLYAGGLFTTVGGAPYNRLVAINTADGTAISTFNPDVNTSQVKALALSGDGTKLYVGGEFTTVGGAPYNRLAAINTSDGTAITTFNPNMGSAFFGVSALALSPDGGTLYAGGTFTTVGGAPYNSLAAINTSNGSAISTFNPNMGGTFFGVSVLALSGDGATLYAGGDFTTVGGTPYNRLVAINTADGIAISTFNPDMGGSVSALALSPDGATLYTGGFFTTVGGLPHNRLVAINTSNGSAISTFNPNMNQYVGTLALSSDGGTLYAGGGFTIFGDIARNNLAHILPDGTVDPNFNPNMGSTVLALALSEDGATLYAGGDFLTVGGAPYNRLSAINTSNGSAISTFNPNMSSTVRALALSPDGTKLYTGGDFTTVGGAPYNFLVAINTADGIATSFNPNMGSAVRALALSGDGTKLYAGGGFTTVGGAPYNRLVAINTSDGIATSFNPNMNGFVLALALSGDGTKLYAGGIFTTVGGAPYNNLAAINTADGSAISTFINPDINNFLWVLALSGDGATLYAGGTFTTVGGAPYNRLAAINTSNGSAISTFNPNMSSTVYALALSGDGATLYAGGDFTTVGGNSAFKNFASFSAIPEVPVPTPTPSRRRSSSGGRSANFISQLPSPSSALPVCASGYTLIPFPANPSGYMCSPNTSGIAPVVEITPGIGLPPVLTPLSFTRNLGSGSVGSDVKLLQQYLNSKGFTLALVGAGSPGNETTFFGMLTRTALSRFQLAHGITPPVGFFGPITRGFIVSQP